MKGKTLEEKLQILERSDESDLELIRNSKKKGGLLTDVQYKLFVGIVGSGLDIALVLITL